MKNDDIPFVLMDSDDAPTQKKHKMEEYPGEFDRLFLRYGRYGTKKLAYKYWKFLSDKDKTMINEHLPIYMKCESYIKKLENYLRDRVFENPVFQDGKIVFDPESRLQIYTGDWSRFQIIWDYYGGLGDIRRAFKEWQLLTAEQKVLAMRHISFYSIVVNDREKPFFEDYLHQGFWRTGQDELEEKFARCF